MPKRLAASLVVVAFLALVGAQAVAGVERERPDARSCCCAAAESPLPTIGSRMCCETRCGKRTGDQPSSPGAAASCVEVPDVPAALVPLSAPAEALAATRLRVALAAVHAAVALHDPPAVYLRTATFLI